METDNKDFKEGFKEDFKYLLDETYVWPAEFPFKFIVSPEQVDELRGLLNDDEGKERCVSMIWDRNFFKI